MDDEEANRLALIPTAHDFVQSAVWLSGGRVLTGGESGAIQIHDLSAALAMAGGAAEAGGSGGGAPLSPTAIANAAVAGAVTLQGHAMAVMCLGLNARGQLISGSVDHTVRVWDLCTGRAVVTLQGHTRSVHCVCMHQLDGDSPAGHSSDLVFSGSRDHTIKASARARRGDGAGRRRALGGGTSI